MLHKLWITKLDVLLNTVFNEENMTKFINLILLIESYGDNIKVIVKRIYLQ